MGDLDLPQDEADTLLGMRKEREKNEIVVFPAGGGRVEIRLQSEDKREFFFLNISQARIDLKGTYQNRARQTVVLRRLCYGRRPHTNPDGETIQGPHLHTYREGFGDRWAYELPTEDIQDTPNLRQLLQDFMHHCNVVKPPVFQWGLTP